MDFFSISNGLNFSNKITVVYLGDIGGGNEIRGYR